ncbi:MAG: lipopolysaccharide biosynthesis protein [Planctomycetia bacterium]
MQAASTTRRRVWSSTALLVLGRVFGSLCTFFVLWRLSHALPPAEFGRFTFWLAVFSVLDTWVDFGTGQTVVARTAARPAELPAALAAARRLRALHGLAGAGFVALAAWIYGEPGATWIVLAALYPLTHALELSTVAKRQAIDYRLHTGTRALSSTLWVAGTTWLLWRGDHDPAHHLLAIAAGSAVGNLVLHALLRRELQPEPAAADAAGLWRASLPLGLAALFQQAYFWVDNLYVRAWCGEELLGAYNIGMRVLSVSIMVVLFATGAALPWFAREHARGALGAAIESIALPLLSLACAGAALLAPWSGEVLALFGEHARAARHALPWLLGAVVAIHLGAALLTGLVACGERAAVLKISAAALALNLALNAWLVPMRGIDGAAQATLATEAFVALAGWFALSRLGAAPRVARLAWLVPPACLVAGWWLSQAARTAWMAP